MAEHRLAELSLRSGHAFDRDVNQFHRVVERLFGRLEGLPENDGPKPGRSDDVRSHQDQRDRGETLDRNSVRSSIKAHLELAGPDTASRDAKPMVLPR